MKKGLFLLFCLFGAFQLFGSASASASASSSSSYADCRRGRNLTDGDNALLGAIAKGDKEAICAALKIVEDLRCKNSEGNTPLKSAILRNNAASVAAVLFSSNDLGKVVSEADRGELLDFVRIEIEKLEGRKGGLTRYLRGKLFSLKNIERLLFYDGGESGESRFYYTTTPESKRLPRSASASSSAVSPRLTKEQEKVFGAICRGGLEDVKVALKSVGDLKFVNRNGNTPLRRALLKGKGAAVKALLDSGKDISEDDKSSLLDFIHDKINNLKSEKANYGYIGIVEGLEKMLVDDDQGENGESRFRYTDTPEDQRLVRSAASASASSSSSSSSSSSYADCRRGRNLTDGDKALLKLISNPNIKLIFAALYNVDDLKILGSVGITPLRAAVGNYKVGIVRIMLESGKNVSQGDKGNLLDYVHNEINKLKNEASLGNFKKTGKKKLSAFKSIEQMLVDDSKGEGRESRFRYTTTREDHRLTRSPSASASFFEDCRKYSNLTAGDKALFIAIENRKAKDVKMALKCVRDLKCVSGRGNAPLKAAILRVGVGIVRILLRSGKDVSQGDKDGLLDYVHNEINKLKNEASLGNLKKSEKRKLSAFKSIEQMLVDDNKGEGRASRFRYTRTPEDQRLVRSAASASASASASSSSSSYSSVPAAATAAAAVVEVSSSSSSSATSAGRATSKRKEPEVDPAADKEGAATGGAQKKRKPSASAVVPAAEAAAVAGGWTWEEIGGFVGAGNPDLGLEGNLDDPDVPGGANNGPDYYALSSDDEGEDPFNDGDEDY